MIFFQNLVGEMAKKGITRKDFSEVLGVEYTTIRNKMNGKTEWLRSEMIKIRDVFFPDLEIEFLFKKFGKRGRFWFPISAKRAGRVKKYINLILKIWAKLVKILMFACIFLFYIIYYVSKIKIKFKFFMRIGKCI